MILSTPAAPTLPPGFIPISLARYYRGLGVRVFFGYLFHHESPLRKPDHVAMMIANAARRAATGERFQLELGDLSVEKEWTFAADTVQGMLTLAQQDNVLEANIGSGIAHSIADWAKACFDVTGREWRDFFVHRQGCTPEYSRLVANPSRIRSLGMASPNQP